MPSNDREVFEHFLKHSGASPEVAHLAYAAYASARYDWVTLFEERNERLPTPAEVDEWIANQPMSRFEEFRAGAEDTFDLAATAYMQDEIEKARDEGVRSALLAEVQRLNLELTATVTAATSTKTAFRVGIFSGLAATVIFTLLVLFGAWVFDKDPSPIAVTKGIIGQPSPPASAPSPPTGPTQ
ncbi:hypothetical protein [Roseomonas sp. KE0001]|uniref:hypothetical protein n=1 Tax=Roseomonas sp. KE0001 TaxID=2479201 RepID=UPI0018E02397|nr:hypothetical protein [Roseomonas sp. KE0001]MBI0436035.1 hypothetical protein [Roseomonas sp. KE0001]